MKSNITNLRNRHITKFTMKRRDKIRDFHSILIPKANIKEGGFYVKLLGSIDNFKNIVGGINEIGCDCRLTYDRKRNKFHIAVPKYVEKKLNDHKSDVVALDTGEVAFLAFYSDKEYGYIGENMREPILRYRDKISQLQRMIAKKKNRRGKRLKHKKKNIPKLERKIRDMYRHIQDLVQELHNQAALYLCKNYHTIIIPKFETQQMVSNKPKLDKQNRPQRRIENIQEKVQIKQKCEICIKFFITL